MLVLVPLSGTALGTGTPTSGKKLLVVGASGGTGMRAIQGLLDVGYEPEQLRILTRDPSKPTLAPLRERAFDLVAAVPPHSDHHARQEAAAPRSDSVFRGRCPSAPQDLDDPATLSDVGASCTGCYVHSTAGDTKQLDTGEVSRARHLAEALKAERSVAQVAFNSAAAEPSHGVKRIAQKHAVEAVFSEELQLPATHLRANLFMEELWKSYTRPGARLALACGTSPSINAHALGRPRMVSRARTHARTRTHARSHPQGQVPVLAAARPRRLPHQRA